MDDYGNTALMIAASRCATDIIKTLIDKGADVNAKNNNGETALFLVARQRRVFSTPDINKTIVGNTIKLLIDKGADVNATNNNGETALMVAASKYNYIGAKILLENGADKYATDLQGKTACQHTSKNDTDMKSIVCPTLAETIRSFRLRLGLGLGWGGKKTKTKKNQKIEKVKRPS